MNRIAKLSKPIITKTNIRNFITIIDQGFCGYREFLGTNKVKLESGIHLKLPLFHLLNIVDLREQQILMDEIKCSTKDTVPITVTGTLFYKIYDPEKACYEVSDYYTAIGNAGMASLRQTIGTFEYDKAISDRNSLNQRLHDVIQTDTTKWGIECTKFEISSVEPQDDNVKKQMERQMEAERKRRENELTTKALITTAEGNKTASVLQAEGEKTSEILKAEGQFYKSQQIANGYKYHQEQIAMAQVDRINKIKLSMPTLTDSQIITMLLEEQRLIHLQNLASNSAKSTYFLDPASSLPQTNALILDKITK